MYFISSLEKNTAFTSCANSQISLKIIFWEFARLVAVIFSRLEINYVLQQSWVCLHGPIIQSNGRLAFKDDLRSGGLLYFISMNASVRTELADSMVTPGEPGGD